jgi:hypothetical protein
LVALAIRARAKAEEGARRLDVWRSHQQASLMAYAYHQPSKMPSLSSLLGERPKAQTAAEQMSILKALTQDLGGTVH